MAPVSSARQTCPRGRGIKVQEEGTLKKAMEKRTLNVNGVDRSLVVDPEKSLADVLREQLLADRLQGLLQRRAMRNLHGHCRRKSDPRLHDSDQRK